VQLQNTTSVAIPDNSPQGAASPIQVNEASAVRTIQVEVELEHSFMSDLEVSLITPLNQVILLQGRNLGRRTRYKGTYTPQTTPQLSRAVGRSAQGQWQLKVTDNAAGDTGTLKSWQLTLGL
jgi:subtilisin-like proprotein convertase family protein